MISTCLVTLLPFFVGLAPHAAPLHPAPVDGSIEDDSVLVRYDLGPILPSFDANGGWAQALNQGFETYQNGEYPRVKVGEIYAQTSPEAVTELIKQVLGDEIYAEGRVVSLEGKSSLLVLAPAPIQKRVADAIQALTDGFSATIGLQVDVIEMPGALPDGYPAALDAAGADRLIQSLQSRQGVRHTYNLQLLTGRTGIIDQRTHRSMVMDYDVEIAKGSVVYDPVVFRVEEGEFFLLQAVPYANGSSLTAIMTHGQMIGDVSEYVLDLENQVGLEENGRQTISHGPGRLQSGQLQNRAVAANAFLGTGQALVFSSQASRAGTEFSRVVVVRQVGSGDVGFRRVDFADNDMSMIVVNASVFDSSSLALKLGEEGYEDGWNTPYLVASSKVNRSAFLYEWAERHFSAWRRIGPWVVIVTKPEWDGDAAADLERLFAMAQPVQDNLALNLTFGRSAGSLPPMRWSLPMSKGSICGVILGTSSTALVDLDVEVASNANAKDPRVVPTFHGLSAAVGVSGLRAARTLDLRGVGSWIDQPAQSFDLGPLQKLKLDQSRVRSMRFSHRGQLPEGQTLRLGGKGQGAPGDGGLYLDVTLN